MFGRVFNKRLTGTYDFITVFSPTTVSQRNCGKFLSGFPSWYLFVQNQKWKNQNSFCNLFKFKNEDSRITSAVFGHISNIVLVLPLLTRNR